MFSSIQAQPGAKVIRIRRGSCSTSDIEWILRNRYRGMLSFYHDDQDAFVAVR